MWEREFVSFFLPKRKHKQFFLILWLFEIICFFPVEISPPPIDSIPLGKQTVAEAAKVRTEYLYKFIERMCTLVLLVQLKSGPEGKTVYLNDKSNCHLPVIHSFPLLRYTKKTTVHHHSDKNYRVNEPIDLEVIHSGMRFISPSLSQSIRYGERQWRSRFFRWQSSWECLNSFVCRYIIHPSTVNINLSKITRIIINDTWILR